MLSKVDASPATRTPLYLEDFAVGQVFRSGSLTVTAADIKAYATQFDPQPFHLDETAAKASLFGGLAASGWHTMALTMRLLVDGGAPIAGGIIGAGADELRWPRPVRPGDELTVESEVLEIRPSRSRPQQGMLRMRSTTFNQNSEPVQTFVANLVVPRRDPAHT
jgi:acyl dehydratase